MGEIQKREEEIIDFWDKEKVYDLSRKKNSRGKKFYLTDGPPYANGHIHMGTALNKILKDIGMRSKRMQGCTVVDNPVYDTHGLPIEFQVEKEIGSKSKQDIITYGVKKFIDQCNHYATRYLGVMNDEFKNLGVWMDWKKPYLTLDDKYIEAVWDVLKKAYAQNLLYLDKYPVHICPRCETAVAFNEIEYDLQKDRAVYVKFPVRGKKGTFLLIWTTTPWTLPANTGVMVHPDVSYSEVEVSSGERWILATDLVDKRLEEFKKAYKKIKEFKGSTLVGWNYDNPLENHLKLKLKGNRRVVSAPRYVTTVDGTGLVHCAPGHGKEDYEVGKDNDLEIISPVGLNGLLGPETGKYQGKKARVVDAEIIEDLKKDGFLAFEHTYSHDYPLCWRCKTPLLMVAQPQWFLRISKIQKKLLEENEKVNWLPSWSKLRMKAWLEGIGDWPISRERYWGTPLPIWMCNKCEKTEVIGSMDELKKKSGNKKVEMHKPGVDEIEWKCSCGGIKHRVSGVFDVWFDSGVSSWAALGYPGSTEMFKKFWPADLNIEGPDQFRGWWNSQMILSYIAFGKLPFNAVSVHGLVLDISKRKMSKSIGNVLAPKQVIEQYGRDYLRYYFAKLSRGEDFAYNEKEFVEIKKVVTILLNVNAFTNQLDKSNKKISLKAEDKWIISRFNSMVKGVTDSYNAYKPYEAIDRLEKFLVEDLSRGYIQMIRDRSDEVRDVLIDIREGLLTLFSPIMPFMTDSVWQELRKHKQVSEISVHLAQFPKHNDKKINLDLEAQFSTARQAIERGLAERDKVKVGVRWPLASASISTKNKIGDEVLEVVARQLNVKKVDISEGEFNVELDTLMTPELESEGYAREFMRKVQSERKNMGLVKDDLIRLSISGEEEIISAIKNNLEMIKKKINAKEIIFVDEKEPMIKFSIKDKKIAIQLNVVTLKEKTFK